MKLLILSDSHKTMTYMCQAVEQVQPHGIVHLGDHERDAVRLHTRFPEIPLWSVSGNCDVGAAPLCIVENIEGVRFYMAHGHTLGVKYGLLRAELAAREAQANVLLFGHTHQSLCDWHNGLWTVNPGTCCGRGRITYAVIDVSQGQIRPEIREIRTEVL